MKEFIENEMMKPFMKAPIPGEIVKGKVIGKEKSTVFVEISNFGTGIVSGEEFSQMKDVLRNIKAGDEISAKILEVDTKNGFVKLSVAEAEEETAWLELKKKKDENETLTVKIVKANKGGLMAKVQGMPAFLPVSQLSVEHYPKVEDGDQVEILKKLQEFIGKDLKVKIIALDPKQKSIIISERAVALENKIEISKNYQVGDVVEGEITGITDFGAFIRFSISSNKQTDEEEVASKTLEGLIHVSELGWQLIHDPAEVVKLGEKVSAKIIEISGGRISLSLKALKEDPWKDLEYKIGDEVEGEVVKFNPFGVFVKIGPEIQALCHISEFKNEKEMKSKLEISKKYKFQISLIKPEEHKMILKLIKPPEETDDEDDSKGLEPSGEN